MAETMTASGMATSRVEIQSSLLGEREENATVTECDC